jgi:hypothetical protein
LVFLQDIKFYVIIVILLKREEFAHMPAVSEKQRRFMGSELARKRAGKKTQTGMSESQLSEFASSKKSKRPLKHKMTGGY